MRRLAGRLPSIPGRRALKRRLLGPPERIPQRALTAAFLLSAAVALSGLWWAATSDVDPGASSLPYLRPVLTVTTSPWAWLVGLGWILRRILIGRDKRYAEQAADVTGYEAGSVRRLAYEARAPDGTTRVIATSEDTFAEIRDRILRALETGDDDTMSLNPDALAEPEPQPAPPESDLPAVLSNLARGARTAATLADQLDLEDEVAAAEADRRWREQFKLLRLDLAATLDFDRLFWSLVVPAAATTFLLLVAARLWVKPWLYPPIAAAGLLVGLLNYVRVSRQTSRRLEALRGEQPGVDWDDTAILVKEVEVPETRVCYAWLAGRTYAHDDREEFAAEVAHRAHELVNDVPVSPSVLEKQAHQLERYMPDLHGFRDDERKRIMDWLLERVEASDYGLVPKAKLIEDCVEHDLQDRRLGPGQKGDGFDPALVRECYRELVPAALVEQEIALEGEDGTVSAVRLRDDPIPPAYGEVRAQFSNQFSNYARWDSLYELPDVDDRLEDEPIYADTLGYRGEAGREGEPA